MKHSVTSRYINTVLSLVLMVTLSVFGVPVAFAAESATPSNEQDSNHTIGQDDSAAVSALTIGQDDATDSENASVGEDNTSQGATEEESASNVVQDPAVPSTWVAAGGTITVSGKDDKAIQQALNEARNAGTASKPVTVALPAGTYSLNYPLYIYSNTTLKLANGTTIVRGSGFPSDTFTAMVYGGGASNYKANYNHFSNVTITGGVWNAGGQSKIDSQILSLRFGNNIVVSNAKLQNATDHMLNIAGSKNVTVRNVTFENSVKFTNYNNKYFWRDVNTSDKKAVEDRYAGIEAVHTDFDTKVGEPGDSLHAGTPAGDVVVDSCTFNNVFSGVGTHHTVAENNAGKASGEPNSWRYKGTALTVKNCKFNSVIYRAINTYSMDNVALDSNTVSGKQPQYYVVASDAKNLSIKGSTAIGALYFIQGTTATVSSGLTIPNCPGNAISADTGSKVTITGITINAPSQCGLVTSGQGTNVTFKDSTINKSGGTAISIDNNSSATVQNVKIVSAGKIGIGTNHGATAALSSNTISSPEENGIWVANSAKATIKNNTIDAAGTTGISLASAANGTVVEGNTVKNSTKWGILASKCQGLTIAGNSVLDTAENGISASDCPNIKVTNNTSTSSKNTNTKRDIYLGSGNKGATVTGNTYGVRGLSVDKSNSGVTNSGNVTEGTNTAGKWTRLYGSSKFATMQKVIGEGWANGSGGTVIIATSFNFADALSASAVAGKYKAPILITEYNRLTSETKAELDRIKPSNIIIVGGNYVVTPAVESAIKRLSYVKTVTRKAGAKASDTAADLAKTYFPKGTTDTAILATSLDYHDALSASPISYAKGYPVFLVDGYKSISKNTLDTMKACGITKVVIVGGKWVVDPVTIEAKLKANGVKSITRKAGNKYWDTSLDVANWGLTLGLNADKMGVATGFDYSDALCGAALCGRNNAILVLTEYNKARCTSIVKANKARINKGYVFGGIYVVQPAVMLDFAKATE